MAGSDKLVAAARAAREHAIADFSGFKVGEVIEVIYISSQLFCKCASTCEPEK